MYRRSDFDHLWSTVGGIGGNLTCSRAELREFLKDTGGEVLRRGRVCDVRSKHLGAGVYKVWLKELID